MTHAPHATHTFDLSGGRLCLDFANTVSGMRGVKPKERLAGYAGLVEFAVQAGAVGESLARRLAAEARRRPREAEKAFEEALALREALYRIFVARANGGEPAGGDVELLSGALSRALSHRAIARRGEGFALSWEDGAALDAPLWPVVESAAELLAGGEELRGRLDDGPERRVERRAVLPREREALPAAGDRAVRELSLIHI